MRDRILSTLALAILSIFNLQPSTARAQTTAFTYQGQLNDGGNPANGTNYGMVFYLYDAPTNGTALGAENIASVTVSNGLFTAPLDFGNPFDGNPRWLEIAVQKNGGSFTTLTPRQQILATPQAIFANSASNLLGVLPASQLSGPIPADQLSGTVPLAQLPATIITNGASGVNISGVFSGNGAGVTNINSANLTGVISDSLLSSNVAFLHAPGSNSLPFMVHKGSISFLVSRPISVTTADVNGDGAMDLILANSGNGSVEVFLNINDGSGRFWVDTIPPLNVGQNPVCVTTADVNGDGKADLICLDGTPANSPTPGALKIFINHGSGAYYTTASTISVGAAPAFVTAADINGDGKVDLITANYGEGTLTILTNNGSGQFSTAQSPHAGYNPVSVAAADVNGDGKVDLISANLNGDSLTVLTNNGSGYFTPASTNVLGINPFSVAAADVNGDGKVDLISANLDNTIRVLTNNGSGHFTPASTNNTGSYPNVVAAMDVNGDGKVDLISVNSGTNTLTVLTNNGSGQFFVAQTPVVGNTPTAIAAADINGDGRVDLISADIGDNKLSLLFGNSAFNLPTFDANQTFSGTNAFTNTGNIFIGDGSGLTGLTPSQIPNLDASKITSGTFSAARLPSLSQLNGALSAAQLPANAVTNTEIGVTLSGAFSGNGAGLTGLSAAQIPKLGRSKIASGTFSAARLPSISQLSGALSSAQLPSNAVTNTETGVTLSGAFSGNGGGLTNLNPSATNSYAPTIGDGTHNFTTPSASGYYSKIGNLVYFEAYLPWNDKGSAIGSMPVAISLPFPTYSARPAFSIAYVTGVINTGQMVGACDQFSSVLYLESLSTTGGPPTQIKAGSCGNTGEVQITGTYRFQ